MAKSATEPGYPAAIPGVSLLRYRTLKCSLRVTFVGRCRGARRWGPHGLLSYLLVTPQCRPAQYQGGRWQLIIWHSNELWRRVVSAGGLPICRLPRARQNIPLRTPLLVLGTQATSAFSRPKNFRAFPTMLTAIRSRALEVDFVSSIAPVVFALDDGVLLDQTNRRCDIDERVTC